MRNKLLPLAAAPVAALTFGIFATNSVSAASYTLNQTSITAAIADPGNAHDGITCDDSEYSCDLAAGDWTLGSDVDMDSSYYSLYLTNSISLTGSSSYTLTGGIVVKSAETTISNLNVVGNIYSSGTTSVVNLYSNTVSGALGANSGTLNVFSGTYTNDTNDAVNVGDNATVNIYGGTFTTQGTSSATVAVANDSTSASTLRISGGTFNGYLAIIADNEAGYAEGPVNIYISGGTFNGDACGLFVADPSLNTIVLSGGTYNGTYGILAYGDSTSVLTNLLASGYYYTNSAMSVDDDSSGDAIVYITGNTTVTTNATNDDTDESSSTSSSSSSSDSDSSTSVGTPDSGYMTGEANASSGILASAAAATVLAGTALATKKKISKRA